MTPGTLAQHYRLNIPPRRREPVIVERKRKQPDQSQIIIEVNDKNASTRFSPAVWRPSTDDDLDFDEEDAFYFGETPPTPRVSSVDPVIKLYEAACKKFKLLPLSSIKANILRQTLTCKFIQLQRDDCKSICYALCCDPYVERLDFQENGMGPTSMYFFAEVIESSAFLTHITIAENDLKSEGARIICEAVQMNNMIVSLDLSGNGLIECDGKTCQMLIKSSTSLQELYLGHNELMDQGVMKIAAALKVNETLKILDLSWNHIRLKGAEAIGEALEQNVSLRNVNLAWNGLYRDGSESLALALKRNDTLTELDLTCNRLTEYCIAEILRGLDDNTTLETLRIGQNHITTRGALAILQHMKENKTSGITLLDFGNQEVHDKFEQLYQEVKKERDLTVLYGAVWSTERPSLAQSSVDNDEVALLACNPLTVLMECMRLQNMRLLDFFKSLDTNKSNFICINELCEGMLRVKIPIRRHTLLQLLHKLDIENNQNLDYVEMVEAQNIHRRNIRTIFAANPEVDFDKTEIGKVSNILRRIMGTQFVMKKTECDARIQASIREDASSNRMNTPSPFQLEDTDTGMSDGDLSVKNCHGDCSNNICRLEIISLNENTSEPRCKPGI